MATDTDLLKLVSGNSPSGLTDALQAALDATPDPESPLAEVEPTSLDELFDRVNNKLIDGLPETITIEDMLPVVQALRAKRYHFAQEQEKKAAQPRVARGKAKPKTVAEAMEVDLGAL